MKYMICLYTIALLAFGCQPKSGKENQLNSNQPLLQYPNADTVAVDTDESIITWIGSKPTGQHDGIIELNEGFVILNNEQLVGGKVRIDIGSLKVMDIADTESNAKLTKHLLSEDFFDLENHPFGHFKMVSIAAFDSTYSADEKTEFPSKYAPATAAKFRVKNPTHVITGELTLKGINQIIAFPVEITRQDNIILIEAKFNIDRTRWNLTYKSESDIIDKLKDKFIYNTVNVGFIVQTQIASN